MTNISYQLDDKIPKVIRTDSYRVQRILINLIGNAIKFTPKGEIKLIANMLSISKKEAIVRFEISDTGIGIPQDKKNYIYEKFTRCTPANRGIYKGSGLGLQIVKRFVEELNGEIEVQSAPDQGTVFYITMPVEIPLSSDVHDTLDQIDEFDIEDELELDQPELVNINDIPNKDDASQLLALLIEDDPLARMAAQNTLKSVGCAVRTADSVNAAKQILDISKFDVVVSDIGLPDGTGFDIARYIKKGDSEGINYQTPFFALTAHSGKNKIEEAEQVGFLAMLTKPLIASQFNVLLNTHVRKISHNLIDSNDDKNDDTELTIIDFNYSKKYGVNEDISKELMDMLCKELPQDVKAVESAKQENDIKVLRELLHKLKGGFCYCGVPRLQKATNELHDAVKNVNSLNEIQNLFDAFYSEADILLNEYQRTKI